MKNFYTGVFLAVVFSLAGFAASKYFSPTQYPQAPCKIAEDPVSRALGFGVCETPDVVCYESKSGQNCFIKTKPLEPTGVATPAPVTTTLPVKKK